MENREPNFKRILISFIIATIIFSVVFLLSYTISYFKYKDVSKTQEELRYSMLSIGIEEEFLQFSCKNFTLYSLSSELDNMGNIITLLEGRLGKNDKNVINQKKMYSLLEAQHFLHIKKYNEKCGQGTNTIIFFYSNAKEYIDEGERMGFILGTLKSKKQETMIYSFDFNLDTNLIKLIREVYGIDKPNSILINEKTKITELKDLAEIEKYLS